MQVPQDPVVLRKGFHEVIFYLFGIFALCKPEALCYAFYMRVHNDARDIVDISADDVCGLSSYPGECGEFL